MSTDHGMWSIRSHGMQEVERSKGRKWASNCHTPFARAHAHTRPCVVVRLLNKSTFNRLNDLKCGSFSDRQIAEITFSMTEHKQCLWKLKLNGHVVTNWKRKLEAKPCISKTEIWQGLLQWHFRGNLRKHTNKHQIQQSKHWPCLDQAQHCFPGNLNARKQPVLQICLGSKSSMV